MGLRIKRLAKTIGFLAVLGVVLLVFYRVFRFKYDDGIYSLDTFYRLEEDSLDVVVLGSSHAFEDVDPAVLWEEHGIAAFDLCGSLQPVWSTYYYLKEAYKTQNPDLILLEAYCLTMDLDDLEEGKIVKNYYGLRPSLDKLQAGMESVPKEQWKNFLPEWVRYHNRYRELDRRDFLPYKGQENYYRDWKGFGYNFDVMQPTSQEDFYTEETAALYEKAETYYRRIIELAKEHGTPLMVFVSPYYGVTREQFGMYNKAAEIAAEYDVPFVNFNLLYDEIGLDFSEDGADWGHLNNFGSTKFTRYLGNYLKERYELPDHRGDGAYASWDRNAQCMKQEQANHQITQIQSLSEYLGHIDQDSYTVILSVSGLPEQERGELAARLEPFEIDGVTSRLLGTVVKEKGEFLFCAGEGAGYLWHRETPGGDMAVRERPKTGAEIYWGESKQNKVEHGVNILVYDSVMQTVVDAVGFDAEDEWKAVR